MKLPGTLWACSGRGYKEPWPSQPQPAPEPPDRTGADGPEVLSLRAEAAVNEYVSEFAPRLLWSAETDGWLEPGPLTPWLLKAGHSPREADAWLRRFPSWAEADADVIDLFSAASAAIWQARTTTAAWAAEHTARVQRWADHRVGRSAPSS